MNTTLCTTHATAALKKTGWTNEFANLFFWICLLSFLGGRNLLKMTHNCVLKKEPLSSPHQYSCCIILNELKAFQRGFFLNNLIIMNYNTQFILVQLYLYIVKSLQ